MCGEKSDRWIFAHHAAGSPPHVRGKGVSFGSIRGGFGITPACAGKRTSPPYAAPGDRDHPRMCGEKRSVVSLAIAAAGSPPHVRGKVKAGDFTKDTFRITPACAGKSGISPGFLLSYRDHPRMCGEKSTALPGLQMWLRITPACAGKRLKRSRSTVPPVAIVPLFPSVCNKPVVSDGSPAGRDAPLFLPAENAVPASPAYNLRSL